MCYTKLLVIFFPLFYLQAYRRCIHPVLLKKKKKMNNMRCANEILRRNAFSWFNKSLRIFAKYLSKFFFGKKLDYFYFFVTRKCFFPCCSSENFFRISRNVIIFLDFDFTKNASIFSAVQNLRSWRQFSRKGRRV